MKTALKTVAILALVAIGCGGVDAARVPDAGAVGCTGAGGIGGMAGEGGAAGETRPDAVSVDASTDTGVDARRDAAIDVPCVPSACIVCVNGVATTPPGSCM